MTSKLLLLLVTLITLVQLSKQGIDDNEIDTDKFNQKGPGGDLIGSLISDMLKSDSAASILQGLLGNSAPADGDAKEGGMDFAMLANVISAFSRFSDNKGSSGEGFDLSSAANLAKSFMNQEGANDFASYLPKIMDMYNLLMGPRSEQIAKEHAGHAWMLPPFIEKFHILIDQLMNSEIGQELFRKLGLGKFMMIFVDENGMFSFRKFVEMMENQSFRKHWIDKATSKIADLFSYAADPTIQYKMLATIQFFMNNFLSAYGIPSHARFDPKRPAESLTALGNYISKKFLGFKFNCAPYVVPAVRYVQNLLAMAEQKGILGRAINANELKNTLTNTINLEIIEPCLRVNRATRFAQQFANCTRYVLCVANQHEPDEMLSLPGLKKMLASGCTFGASWILSGNDKVHFWTLYTMVQEGKDCERFHTEECNNFHVEEEKVTTEYVHSEL